MSWMKIPSLSLNVGETPGPLVCFFFCCFAAIPFNKFLHMIYDWNSLFHRPVILSMVYNQPTQRPAPNLLDSLIIWHWKVKGISQRSKVRIPYKPDFFRPSFRNWKNCVCNCDDLLLFRVQLVKQKHQSLAVSWANGRSLNVSLALVRWGCAFNRQVRAPLRSDNVFATCGTSVLKLLDEV